MSCTYIPVALTPNNIGLASVWRGWPWLSTLAPPSGRQSEQYKMAAILDTSPEWPPSLCPSLTLHMYLICQTMGWRVGSAEYGAMEHMPSRHRRLCVSGEADFSPFLPFFFFLFSSFSFPQPPSHMPTWECEQEGKK